MSGAIAIATVFATSGLASAGGAWMQPVADRYEPGDSATIVGYFTGITEGTTRPVFISSLPYDASFNLPEDSERIPVGILLAEKTTYSRNQYRASTTFEVPDGLEPGVYNVSYDWENGFLGDLIGGPLYVSVDPERAIRREWPHEEPEIENLADSAILIHGTSTITAGELRAGVNLQATTTVLPRASTIEAAPASVAVPVAADVPPPPFPYPSHLDDVVVTEFDPAMAQDVDPAGSTAGWALGSALLALLALVSMVFLRRQRQV